MTETPGLPPLPPPRLGDLAVPNAPRVSRVPIAVAAVALVVAATMALLWLSARGNADDIAVERDAAIAERDAASIANITADAELQTARDELAAARDELSSAPDPQDDTSDSEELQVLQDRADELSAEVERLEEQNETLAADLEAARTAAADADPAPETTVGEEAGSTSTTEPVTETTVVSAVTPEELGDELAGLFRADVLGTLQKICLGQFVIDDLGELRALVAIESDSPGDDEEFVRSLAAAAEFCNVDSSAVFG